MIGRGELGAAAQTEFLKDADQMDLDGGFAHGQRDRQLLVALAGRRVLEDLPFAVTEKGVELRRA